MSLRFARLISRLILDLVANVQITGMDNLPLGNFVIAANHLGRLDTLLVLYALEYDDIIHPMTDKYKSHPLFGLMGRLLRVTWLKRKGTDYAAMREMMTRLAKGGVLVITPEGQRSKSGGLLPGQPGVVYLASKAGVPIVPVAITGTEDEDVCASLKRLQRLQITITAGPSYMPPPLSGKGREKVLREATDEIMYRIAELLPETHRGVYANRGVTRHPNS
ncbi:MAG: lysophospholipid acyltransferase family protein [Chloroflexota bacterium]